MSLNRERLICRASFEVFYHQKFPESRPINDQYQQKKIYMQYFLYINMLGLIYTLTTCLNSLLELAQVYVHFIMSYKLHQENHTNAKSVCIPFYLLFFKRLSLVLSILAYKHVIAHLLTFQIDVAGEPGGYEKLWLLYIKLL